MLIEEIMIKDVLTLSPENTVKDALDAMRDKKIRHLPILSADGTVVGIVTDRRLERSCSLFHFRNKRQQSI